MSFSDWLFGASKQSRSASVESYIAAEFAPYKNYVNEIINRENTAVQSLGMTPPRMISEVHYEVKITDDKRLFVKLIPPRFEFPPHRTFIVNNHLELVVTVFESIEYMDGIYEWWGLGDVVRTDDETGKSKYGAVWTNRDPYAFYRELQNGADLTDFWWTKSGDLVAALQSKGSWTHNKRNVHEKAIDLARLRLVRALSSAEASKIDLRVQLLDHLTDYRHDDLKRNKCFNPSEYEFAAARLPEDLFFSLPVPCTWITDNYSCLKIVPAGEIKPAQMVEFLNSLRDINHFFFFELVRVGETVCFRFQFPSLYTKRVTSKLALYFPDAERFDEESWLPLPSSMRYTVNWLEKKGMNYSINRLRDFQLDPYAHFASFFDEAAPSDYLCYQVIFAPLLDEAADSLKEAWVYNHRLLDEDEQKQLTKKLPLWFVSICVCGTNKLHASQLAQTAARAFDASERNFYDPYVYTSSNKYFPQWVPAFLSMFGTEELASLAHFPTTKLPIERLEQASLKNVQPPDDYKRGETVIGVAKARGQTVPVSLPETVRDRHVYVVGKSGTGKSTLVEAIARRDIEAGGGVAVIDPHGDLIQHLLKAIPERRVSDCILFSPKHFPVSLEILSAENEHEIDLLSDDLITMFRRTSESWGDKMQAILQMAFQTLLRVPGSSFTDITPLLTDENYRNRILSKINHPQLVSFWRQRYDMRQAEPILIRMDRLTTSGTLRSVLTQNKNSLNFYDVVTEGKIFLADLSKGFLGESTSHLLGSIIVSQIQLAAMRQAHLPAEQRVAFSLFVDEVQNFTTSAFSTILSEARKQKLRLTIAHQFVSQLPGDLQKAVFGNVGTLVFFALSPDDLGAARHELGTFEPSDVANLPKYHALCRPATAAKDTFSFATNPPQPLPAKSYAKVIIEQTRREYGATPIVTEEEEEPTQTANGNHEPKPEPKPEEKSAPRQAASFKMDLRRPAASRPLSFVTNTEKILHFLRQAEYLSQPQIIALTDLQASNASTALKKLVETGQIKSLDDRRPKIYFLGRNANSTTHNLLVRDLFVKIYASNYAVRSVKFNDNLAELNPDLTVEFIAEDDDSSTPLLAYFELDRGTEGISELVRKAERYARIPNTPRVGFIFERESDMKLARKTIEYPFILYAALDQFTSLQDRSFYAGDNAPANTIQLPFFW